MERVTCNIRSKFTKINNFFQVWIEIRSMEIFNNLYLTKSFKFYMFSLYSCNQKTISRNAIERITHFESLKYFNNWLTITIYKWYYALFCKASHSWCTSRVSWFYYLKILSAFIHGHLGIQIMYFTKNKFISIQ